jgi:hypothetical protein
VVMNANRILMYASERQFIAVATPDDSAQEQAE